MIGWINDRNRIAEHADARNAGQNRLVYLSERWKATQGARASAVSKVVSYAGNASQVEG